ncbi:putative pentatricopeptide repeat-containing protein At3g13770, mitochondrial [Arachis ipaensis]|nr:putative pentatricopeptide repeat-containing protein At3g13770, mitochondrial [Arachis ipaensis]XP_025657468.1 putative pentatricopeptide repeat-containing protein At3g13770, mitochondrial [Arachis hypogaea]
MELKLHSSMASLGSVPRKLNTVISSHSKFPHFSPSKPSNCSLPSTPLCSYAVPDSKNPTTNSNKVQPRRKNATPTGRFAQKTQTSRKENLPREPKPKLDNTHNRVDQNRQNALFDATTLNVNLIELCEEGKLAETLELMGQGSVADYGVFLAMLNLCEGTRSLEYGKKVHEFLRRSRFRGEVELNNRLIGMYGKCGNMNIARKVFDRMPERNMSSWHLMIIGYTENGAVVSGLSGGEKRGRRRERGAAVWVVAGGCGEGRWLWRC